MEYVDESNYMYFMRQIKERVYSFASPLYNISMEVLDNMITPYSDYMLGEIQEEKSAGFVEANRHRLVDEFIDEKGMYRFFIVRSETRFDKYHFYYTKTKKYSVFKKLVG